MPPLAIAFILIGFLCGGAALVKSLRPREVSDERAKAPLILGNIGMIFFVAAGAVLYLNNR